MPIRSLEKDYLESEDVDPVSGWVSIGGRKYAIGLVWRSLPEGERYSASLAKKEAKELGRDVYILRGEELSQAGYGARSLGHRPGMRSLADVVVSHIEGAFLAAFPLEEGFYILAVREDRILPNTDIIVSSEENARRVFEELRRSSLWPLVYAPDEWDVRGARGDPIETFLENARSRRGLVDATLRTAVWRALAAGVIVAGGLGVAEWLGKLQDIDPIRNLDELRRQAEIEREAKRARARAQVFPDGPWVGRPNAALALDACLHAMYRIPTAVPGWRSRSVSCVDNGDVVLAVERDGGAVSWAEAWAHWRVPAGLVARETSQITSGAGGLNLVWSVPDFAQLPKSDRLTRTVSLRTVEPIARRFFDDAAVRHDIASEQGPPQSFLDADGEPVQRPLWRSIRISYQTEVDPRQYAWLFYNWSTAVLEHVGYDMASGTWSVRVMVYERIGYPGLSIPGVPE